MSHERAREWLRSTLTRLAKKSHVVTADEMAKWLRREAERLERGQ